MGGRPKGGQNKTTLVVKQAIESAYQSIGGDPAFAEWAQKNRKDFYTLLLAKLIPRELTGAGGSPLIPPAEKFDFSKMSDEDIKTVAAILTKSVEPAPPGPVTTGPSPTESGPTRA